MIVGIFDTETTGLIDNHVKRLDRQPEVIEFACVLAEWDDLSSVVARYETLVRPQYSRLADKPAKEKPHHLTDEDLADQPTFDQIEEKVQALLTAPMIICGHNLSYDMEVIDIEYERLRKKIRWPQAKICTVEQTMHINGNRIKLSDLHQMATGRPHDNAHRAMDDVQATLTCLRWIREKGWL